ncbi:MAG: peptidase S10 [Planctomycetes bacterium]|nr:peptidase S10 [Planctomycetota bacterium]
MGKALKLCLLIAGILASVAVFAQRADEKRPSREHAEADTKRDAKDNERSRPEVSYSTEKMSSTAHTASLGGETINYTATAGNFVLTEEDGTKKASYFFVAYTKDKPGDLSRRPLTFSFNGGPGSCSVWLHLGVFGPRRVKMGDEGMAPTPPYELIDNECSILDKTDLVFMDPVSTGFSRPLPGEEADQFHGVQEDVQWNAEFIRMYVGRNNRWLSPLFLAGESYGTFRACMLAHHLQGDGIYLNGLVLVSAFLNPEGARGDLAFALALPTIAASAWFHKKLPEELQKDLRKTLDEVEKFSLREYLPALALGSRLAKAERDRIRGQLARYSGLPEDTIERANLRITGFSTELLKDKNLQLGAYDTRYTGPARTSATGSFTAEPSIAPVMGPYAACIRSYLRNELKYETELPYEILGDVSPWNWSDGKRERGSDRIPDASARLAGALMQNPRMKVLMASGYYDQVTRYSVSDYVFAHMDISDELRKNLRTEYYEAGHMMYLRQSALKKLKADLDSFYAWAAN